MDTKRSLKFNYADGSSKTISLQKVTALALPIDKVCLHIDKISESGYLLLVNENFWNPVDEKLINIEVVRGE